MFGNLRPRMGSLDEEEKQRYHACYCGLCRALQKRWGNVCRLGASYDMTFLALLLCSLYEPPEQDDARRCMAHPAKKQDFVINDCLSYAADMNVILMYFKCLDDWNDEGKISMRAAAALLKSAYGDLSKRYKRQCQAIEEALGEVAALEVQARKKPQTVELDTAANAFALSFGEMFAYRQDFWFEPLRSFGTKLGKFVYVMDAAQDTEQDAKTGNYNPFVDWNTSEEDQLTALKVLAADAARAFERLPLEKDMHLLRSVIYAGMWQPYLAKKQKKEKKNEGRPTVSPAYSTLGGMQ